MGTNNRQRGSRRQSPADRRTAGDGILFGTDFSASAHQAAFVAAAIARRLGEPMTLLHAVEFPDPTSESGRKALRWLTTARRKDLHKEARSLGRDGATVESKLIIGRPDEALVNSSKAENARLIVVSSIGRRGVDRWLLGSVAERTAARAPVPTLVLREPEPWLEWAKGARPLRVFACFNQTVTSEAALRWGKDFSKAGPIEVIIGWVNWPAEEWARTGGIGPLSLSSNPPDVQRILEREVTARAKQILGNSPFRVRVETGSGRVDARLAEMAREERADLIVAGSHQYRGFERLWHSSVSLGLLNRASMSVAIVPHVSAKTRPAIPPPMQQVLVATDFSELGNAAVPQAFSLMRSGGAVHLLHVLPDLGEFQPGVDDRRVAPHNSEESQQLTATLSELRALIPAEAEAQGIFAHLHVLRGRNIATTICQQAERLGVDMICLGSHGRSGLAGALMGSVAQEVMARSRRPLLVIRQPLL